MQKYTVELSGSVQKLVDSLPENEKGQVYQELEKLSRNPYTGEPMWGGWKTRIKNKISWFIREAELKFGSVDRG